MSIKSSIWSGFEIKNWIEDQFQSSPKLVGIWTVLRCIFVPNLEIVTSIDGELWWHGQAQNGVNVDFEVKFDLEGQGQTIGILTKVFYIWSKFGDPSLNGWWVIVRTSSWLMHGRTHTHTDRRRQRQYLKAKTGPVMMIKTTIFTHPPHVSLAQSSFCWWRHNQLLMMSQ